PAAPAPPARLLTVDDAIAEALRGNLGLQISRNSLAGAQSSLIAARNRFHFKLATDFHEGNTVQRDAQVVAGIPVALLLRDVIRNQETLGSTLSKAEEWG